MNKLILSVIAISLSNWALSQIIPPPTYPIYFQYDESGNQVFRGDGMLSRSAVADSSQNTETVVQTSPENSSSAMEEKDFWNNIRIYPVPVKDYLTIEWNDSVKDLISEVGLYEQNTVHWVFQSKKIPTLDKTIKINMTKQYMGVYILTFTLKDGRRFSKNITKY